MSSLARLGSVGCENGHALSFEIEQDKSGELASGLRVVTTRLLSRSRQIATNTAIQALDSVRVRFAPEVPGLREDSAVALPMVGGVSELIANRNHLAQRSGCSGAAITQRPAEYWVGSAINSPPEPNELFFCRRRPTAHRPQ